MNKLAVVKSTGKKRRVFEIPPRSVLVKGSVVEVRAQPAFEGLSFPPPRAAPAKRLDLSKVQLAITVATKHASPQAKARNPPGNPWGEALVGLPASRLVATAKVELWQHLVYGPAREHYARPIADALAKVLEGLKSLRTSFDALENANTATELYAKACLSELPETLESMEQHLPRLELLRGMLGAGLRPTTELATPQLESWRVLMRAARYTEHQIAELEVKAEVYCYEKETEAFVGMLRPNQPAPVLDAQEQLRSKEAAQLRFVAAETGHRPELRDVAIALQKIIRDRTRAVKTTLNRFRAR